MKARSAGRAGTFATGLALVVTLASGCWSTTKNDLVVLNDTQFNAIKGGQAVDPALKAILATGAEPIRYAPAYDPRVAQTSYGSVQFMRPSDRCVTTTQEARGKCPPIGTVDVPDIAYGVVVEIKDPARDANFQFGEFVEVSGSTSLPNASELFSCLLPKGQIPKLTAASILGLPAAVRAKVPLVAVGPSMPTARTPVESDGLTWECDHNGSAIIISGSPAAPSRAPTK